MLVEICAYSLASCLVAQRAGANRIELCGAVSEGGLTPSAGLIQLARERVTIPLYVMIRPRGGDFLYSDIELDVMRADIVMAKQLGADGLVFGMLQADGTVAERQTRELIELAYPLPVTFHRAFDMAHDPAEALEAIIRAGAATVLTSGQQSSAPKGIQTIHQLVRQAGSRIDIMAGAGINPENVHQFAEAGVQAVHLSGKVSIPSAMQFRRLEVSMASATLDEYERIEAHEQTIRTVVEAVA